MEREYGGVLVSCKTVVGIMERNVRGNVLKKTELEQRISCCTWLCLLGQVLVCLSRLSIQQHSSNYITWLWVILAEARFFLWESCSIQLSVIHDRKPLLFITCEKSNWIFQACIQQIFSFAFWKCCCNCQVLEANDGNSLEFMAQQSRELLFKDHGFVAGFLWVHSFIHDIGQRNFLVPGYGRGFFSPPSIEKEADARGCIKLLPLPLADLRNRPFLPKKGNKGTVHKIFQLYTCFVFAK